jgi:NAD(P)-dependent dehydrogenase (short-subunit alcohol dehydrogenase family)
MTAKFDGKVVLITGTGGGIGRQAALKFAAEGARVVGCDVNIESNLETVRLVKAAGGTIDCMSPVDLSNANEAKQWVEDAAALHGRIDIVYNNASAARFAPIESMTEDDWQFTLRNELDLVFYVTRYAWPFLKRQGGVIINTGSTAGIAGSGPGGTAHAATKGAVIAMSKHLAQEGAADNIRVVTISPGFVETPGTAAFCENPAMLEMLVENNMIKRPGKPAEIAAAAVFMASDEAGYITGSNLVIDGGRTSW